MRKEPTEEEMTRNEWPAPLKAKARQTQVHIEADIKANRTRLITKIFGSLKACVEAGVITDIVTKDPFIKALMLRLGFTKPHRNSGDGLTQHETHGRSASKRKKPRFNQYINTLRALI